MPEDTSKGLLDLLGQRSAGRGAGERKASPAPPRSTPAPPKPSGIVDASIGLRSLLETRGAEESPKPNLLFEPVTPSLAEAYEGSELQKTLERIIPESIRQTDKGNYVARFLDETYRAAPQVVDFIASPVGLGLIAAHIIPQTRGLAAAADFGLALYQGKETLDATKEFYKDRSPENLSRMVIAMAGSWGLSKASGAAAASRRRRLGPERISDTEPIINSVISTGDEHLAALPTTAERAEISAAKRAKTESQIEKLDTLGSQVDPPYRIHSDLVELPRDFALKQLNRLYSVPVLRDFASIANIPKNKLLEVGADIVKDRRRFFEEQFLKVNRMRQAIASAVPEEELRIYSTNADGTLAPANKIAAVIQGTVTADQAGLSPAGRLAVEKIKQRTRERDALMREFYGDQYELLDPDTYLTQIWDFGDQKSQVARATRTTMRDRFIRNQRAIDSYTEGIEIFNERFLEDPTQQIVRPKYNNVLEVLKAREEHAIAAIANGRMAKTLREMGAMLNANEAQALKLQGEWKQLREAPALYHATYSGTESYRAEAASRQRARRYRGEPMTTVTQTLTYKPVWVHPGIEQAVSAVFEKPFEHPAASALTNITSFTKKNVLGFSFFHPGALTEVGQAVQLGSPTRIRFRDWIKSPTLPGLRDTLAGSKPARVAQATYVANPDYWRGVRAALWELSGKPPRGSDAPPLYRLPENQIVTWVRRGLPLDVSDRLPGFVERVREVGRKSPNPLYRMATAPIRLWGTGMYVLDKPLWDYYFPGQMLNAAETLMASETQRIGPHASAKQVELVGRQVAEHVANIYGGIGWDKLLVSPKTAQVMSWLMLAPAWRASQLRVLTQGFEGTTATRLSGRYIRNGALAWFLSAQMFNYVTSSWYGNPDKNGDEGGHFTWDNPGIPVDAEVAGIDTGIDIGLTSNAGNIAMGFHPDGRERYLVLNKAMRDSLGYMMNPVEEVMSGIHPLWRGGWSALTGFNMSGFEVIDREFSQLEQRAQQVDTALRTFAPFVASEQLGKLEHYLLPEVFPIPATSTQLYGFPASTGLSYKDAKEMYVRAIEDGDLERAAVVLRVASLNKMNLQNITNEYAKKQRERMRNRYGSNIRYDQFGEPLQ